MTPHRAAMRRLRDRARRLKSELLTLGSAIQHPATPWYAKVVVLAIVAYALSPIDLVPDFIPVLGYVDDLLLLPLGVALARRLVPDEVLEQCRSQSVGAVPRRAALVAAALIVAAWLAVAWALACSFETLV